MTERNRCKGCVRLYICPSCGHDRRQIQRERGMKVILDGEQEEL